MATILDTILSEKKVEVENLKKKSFRNETKRHAAYSLLSKLENSENLAIIAEFKRASPSKGVINTELDPVTQTQSYTQFGADAVSVLTDNHFFKGSFTDLEAVRSGINVPLLCKDFIIDPIQIDLAKHSGANIILLIVAAMSEEKLVDLYQYAMDQGLEVLVEVHDEMELDIALRIGAKLIGVNNRNLKTFEVDLSITERLGPIVRDSGAYLISESGIATVEDVLRVAKAGANGILVGETFMKAQDLAKAFSEMKVSVQKVEKI